MYDSTGGKFKDIFKFHKWELISVWGVCETSTVVILGPEIEDPALSQVNDSHVDSGKKFMIWLKKK